MAGKSKTTVWKPPYHSREELDHLGDLAEVFTVDPVAGVELEDTRAQVRELKRQYQECAASTPEDRIWCHCRGYRLEAYKVLMQAGVPLEQLKQEFEDLEV